MHFGHSSDPQGLLPEAEGQSSILPRGEMPLCPGWEGGAVRVGGSQGAVLRVGMAPSAGHCPTKSTTQHCHQLRLQHQLTF